MFFKTQQIICYFTFCLLFSQTLFAQTFIEEDFSSGALPTDWTNIDNGSTGELWQFNNPGGRSIGGDFDADFVILDSDEYGAGGLQNARLTTPTFSYETGTEAVYLEYDYQFRSCCGATIIVEFNDGSNWQQIASYTSSPNHPGTDREQINLRDFANSVTDGQIRFVYTGAWDYWMAIDNFKAYAPLDTDGDGIFDETDLDDDNDGIPDDVETTCFADPTALIFADHWAATVDPLSTAASPSTVFEDVTVSLERRDPLNILDFSAGETGITTHNGINSYKVTQASQVGGYTDHIFKFSKPVENLVFGVIDIDAGNNFTDHIVVNAYSSGSIYSIQPADIVSGSANGFNTGQNSFTGSSATTTYPNGLAQVSFPVPIDSIVMIYSNEDATPSATQAIAFDLSIAFNCLLSDADNDGIPNHLDLDSDNDGIPDLVEAGGTDTNGDGTFDGNLDSDNDGTPDYADPDHSSCNGGDASAPADGICDDVQAGASGASGMDDDGDGIDNAFDVDINGDGTIDVYVAHPIGTKDTDNDGLPDHLDLDADNDGIPDLVEAGGSDDNGDGMVDNFNPTTGTYSAGADGDGDGFSGFYDNDGDNNGTIGDATPLIVTSTDSNDDGAPESIVAADMDKDGIYNHLDLDADNDGIVDLIEALGTDSNGDGMVDDFNPASPTTFDTEDKDGWSPTYDGDAANDGTSTTTGDGSPMIVTNDSSNDGYPNAYLTGDAESDLHPNFLDIDADNDGIVDNVEGQSTAGYTLPNTTTIDSDMDGINDAYDNFIGFGGTGIDVVPASAESTLNDIDMDGTPDYLDFDSDGDNIPDEQEAWDFLTDGDSRTEASIGNCDGSDVDNDGLLDCYDNDLANPTVTSYKTPIDDNAFNGGAGSAMGPISGSTPDDIFPDNGGVDHQADWRDVLIDCSTPRVYYAISEASAGTTTDYEWDGTEHSDGANTQIVRATAACLGADDYYYYYNPLEPENYLFAIRNTSESPNTIPIWDLIDYVETKVEPTPANRHQVGSTSATFVMERDWNVQFKGTPTSGSTFDVKFYFDPTEMNNMKTAADAVEAGESGVVRDFVWFEKTGGIQNSDISATGISDMEDISSLDSDPTGISDSNPNQTDGTTATPGNGKNYVEFSGLSDFSGGTAAILMTFSALPVELSRFFAKVQSCDVQLNWRSESEEKFSHYELEWSGGGRSFQKIGVIEARGGNESQDYQLIDERAAQDNYYRLKMVDEDDTFEYSSIIHVQTDCADLVSGIDLYPNPVSAGSAGINVRVFAKKELMVLSIVDLLGRRVKEWTLDVELEWNNLFLNINDLPVGTYYLKIAGEKGSKAFIVRE